MKTLDPEMARMIKLALERPEAFGYSGELDLFNTWGLCGPAQTRDSDVLTRSNFQVITKDMLERFPDDCEIVGSGHWAHGWMDQLAVRVIEDNGKPTDAFEALLEWNKSLSEYPIADEMDYSQKEWDEFEEWAEFEFGTDHIVEVMEILGESYRSANEVDNELIEEIKDALETLEGGWYE